MCIKLQLQVNSRSGKFMFIQNEFKCLNNVLLVNNKLVFNIKIHLNQLKFPAQ